MSRKSKRTHFTFGKHTSAAANRIDRDGCKLTWCFDNDKIMLFCEKGDLEVAIAMKGLVNPTKYSYYEQKIINMIGEMSYE